MINLIPSKEYVLKNVHKTPYEHVVRYVMPQKLSSKDEEVWETFYYKDYREEELMNRVIVPQRGIISITRNILTCSNYFFAGGFFSGQEANPQEIKEWLIMIQRLEEFKFQENMYPFIPLKKEFIRFN